jgi:TATA-box binding protein (TBP) (component of TFIID and TFIIIB)
MSSTYETEDRLLAEKYLQPKPDRRLTCDTQPECYNVVCHGRYGKPIDQQWLLREFPNCSLKRGRFPAATIWFRPPEGATGQFFTSGNVMIMGIHSVAHACAALQVQRREFIQHGRDDYPLFPLQIENFVYRHRVPYHIHISQLKHEDELGFILVPELFPGAVYRMFKPAVAMLIFESGSIMILGVRDDSDLAMALDNVLPILEQHSYIPDGTAGGGGSGSKRGASSTGKRKFKSDEEKRNERDRKQIKAAVKKALRKLKYAPVRNRAEFEALLENELAPIRRRMGTKTATATAPAAATPSSEQPSTAPTSAPAAAPSPLAKKRKVSFAASKPITKRRRNDATTKRDQSQRQRKRPRSETEAEAHLPIHGRDDDVRLQ